MAGQVDIIISEKAQKEIDNAVAKLETLRLKILAVNSAGAKTTGVSNNDKIVEEIKKTNQLIAAQNKLVATKRASAKAQVGSAKALMNEISALKKQQLTLSNSNKSWLQYQLRIMKVESKLKSLTKVQSQVSIATRKTSNSVGGFSKSLGGIGNILKGGGVLFALSTLKNLAVNLVKSVFDLAKQFDSLRFALERTSSSLSEAKMNSAFMLQLSSDLGLSLIATTTRFIKFSAAARNSGLAMKDVQKIFGTMAKAGSVLGLRTDELSGVFLALEQMLSKGKVTTEELRRQLGERLPGAFGIMAASLGVTLPKLDEMLKKGELLSADVLPGFARAVELAFGLDTVDKVDTLTASQNRLATSFQNFVKNITGEGSVLKGFFKGLFVTAENFINGIDKLFNSREVDNAERLKKGFDDQTKLIEKAASEELELTRKKGNKLKDLEKASTLALANAKGKLKDDIAHEEVKVAVKNILDYQAEIDKIEEKIAKQKYEQTFIDFAFEETIVKKHRKKIIELETAVSDKSLEAQASRGKNIQKLRQENDLLRLSILKLNDAEGRMNATRLKAESSTPVVVDGNNSGGSGGSKDIVDFERKKQAEIIETQIKSNAIKIENSKAGDKKVEELIEENRQNQINIVNLLEQDKIEILKKGIKEEIKSIKEKFKNEKDITEEAKKNISDLEKQESDKIRIIRENSAQDKLDIEKNSIKNIQEAVKKDFAFQIMESEAKFAKDNTENRIHYEKEITAVGLTQEAKSKLNKDYLDEKDKLEIKSHNASIDLMILEVTALSNLTTATDAQKQSLSATIAVLENSKKIGKVESGESTVVKTEAEKFQEMLSHASDYANALNDITSGIFDSRISDIDAEMEATRVKYDEMFLLADGDAKQTKLLRIQEARDLEKLETKKKKLQRQKAIADKANAIIQIAINTAVAVSRVMAQTGAISPVLIPLIVGLGALQTAAVLAQPLPKFAQGGTMSHDGLAVVGDGGKQEVIRTPDGKISLTPSTDTVVNLQKGTEIFSSVEKFNQQNPNEMSNLLHSSTLLASISLNQKNINGMMSGQKILDERLLDAMLLNTKAVKKSQSNTYIKTQKIDIAHEIWKSNLLN